MGLEAKGTKIMVFDIIRVTVFFAIAVWLIPGLLGGLITTFALRRVKGSLQVMDVISTVGQWMFSFFLGGLVVFGVMIIFNELVPEGQTAIPQLLIDYLSFGVGAAVMGARGAKIILEVLNYS